MQGLHAFARDEAPGRRGAWRRQLAVGLLGIAAALCLGASTAPAEAPAEVDAHIADGSAQHALDAARQRWQQAGSGDYHFDARRICFCAPPFTQPATIVVRGGHPLGAPTQLEDVATVPRMFKVVQKAIDDRVAELTVRYSAIGVPQDIYVDRSRLIADEEVHYQIDPFTLDRPYAGSRGDVYLYLRWKGPEGDASGVLRCSDGRLASSWPDPAVCIRLLATPALSEPITIELRDLRITRDPQLFAVSGWIEGHAVGFVWPGQGSSTRLSRLQTWETALGPAAIDAVRH